MNDKIKDGGNKMSSDINLDAQVYLLYEMPTSLLARRFNYEKCETFYKIQVKLASFFFI